ncbi:MAG: hypothetical protein WD491_08575 [Balneolales bacterium]
MIETIGPFTNKHRPFVRIIKYSRQLQKDSKVDGSHIETTNLYLILRNEAFPNDNSRGERYTIPFCLPVLRGYPEQE